MSNVSHARSDLSGHPDASEMRARYDRVMGGRDVALVDAPVFLVGLYCAVSPWVLHFTASQPALVTHNLVMGIAIAVLALGFTVMPERMYGLSWAMCAIGAWIIVSTWVVGDSPDAGIVINNIIVGGLTVLLGMVCAGAAARTRST
ncbi:MULTISPECIES: SPW repeat protein [Streptomyces]|uniref:SPW repeat protein n=1 Tax=Streptomyces rubiginosohelvolus TaxID=67362 RepID=A0ABW6FC31_9ACTN|nr:MULTISPECIES: SPW repeat protein [unclassified Streptomyces]MBK3529049.1 SPW repeat protein [Streptomyces sp. MBT72]MBK3540515.1 SPW repeat protein [Streptomyces sp. MBT67]MBK3550951.1 SPW repeat protein [Streptomyces sp. MBT61]MBK6031497.1 SPW repeat protein [Streptomyces sp. MBT59]